MDQKNITRLINRYIERLIKESQPGRPAWNREQISAGYSWSYVNALFMKALMELYRDTMEDKYLVFVDSFMSDYVMEDGTIRAYKKDDYNIDHICGGTVLMDLYRVTGKEKYWLAVEMLMQQLREQPRTAEGNFWHKNIYPNQVWLDGLYMAQPFYMRYGAEKERELCSDSFRQFLVAAEKMKDPQTGLYFHGYDQSRKAFWCDKSNGLSKSFWLRSIGWFCMACVDIMEVMPEDMQTEKQTLQKIFQEIIDALLSFCDRQSGMWYQVVDKGNQEGNYLETSGSAMIAYAVLKGVANHYLDESYWSYGENTFYGICRTRLSEIDGELQLGGICLVAGLGGVSNSRDGTYDYYISEPVVENDGKGVGPFLLAYTQLCRNIEREDE